MVHYFLRDAFAEREGRSGAGATGVFPLGLGWQAIGTSRRPWQLCAERFRLAVRHAHHRLSSTHPEFAVQALHRRRRSAHHGAPLIDRHGIFAEIERRDSYKPLRSFEVSAGSVARRRAHREGGARDLHHVQGRAFARAFEELLRAAAAALRLPAVPVERHDVESERAERKVLAPGGCPRGRWRARFGGFPQIAMLSTTAPANGCHGQDRRTASGWPRIAVPPCRSDRGAACR